MAASELREAAVELRQQRAAYQREVETLESVSRQAAIREAALLRSQQRALEQAEELRSRIEALRRTCDADP